MKRVSKQISCFTRFCDSAKYHEIFHGVHARTTIHHSNPDSMCMYILTGAVFEIATIDKALIRESFAKAT